MLKVAKKQDGTTLQATLSGTIDEADDLGALIGTPTANLIVNCKEVSRINSVGVKAWVKYFTLLQQKKITVKFEELASPLVEQLNVIQNFTCGGQIVSVAVPFVCGKCKTRTTLWMKTGDIKKMTFPFAPTKCPKCGGESAFDDIEDEYFAFLQRQA